MFTWRVYPCYSLYPLNTNIFTDHDFAPSQASSSLATAHLPPLFPLDIPSSPITVSEDLPDEDVELCSPTDNPAVENAYVPPPPPLPPPGPPDCVETPPANAESQSHPIRSCSSSRDPTYILNPSIGPSHSYSRQCGRGELEKEVDHLHSQNDELFKTVRAMQGQISQLNTQCKMAHRKVTLLAQQLRNKKQQPWKSKKIETCSVTAPHLAELFRQEQAERIQKEQEEALRQAQKKAEDNARTAQIEQDILNHIFDCLLSTFLKRKKNDLITLAGALGLS